MTAASTYNGAGTRRDPGFIGRMWAMIVKEFVQMRRDRMTFATMLVRADLAAHAVRLRHQHRSQAFADGGARARRRAADARRAAAMKNTDYFDFGEQVALPKRARPAGAGQGRCSSPSRSRQASSATCGAATGRRCSSSPMPPTQWRPAPRLRRAGRDRHGARARIAAGRDASVTNSAAPFELVLQRRYNPEGITQYNIVPGLLGVVLTMTMMMFTALAVTREIERGTMESLLAMPIKPVEIMIGKIAPFVLVGFVQMTIILVAAHHCSTCRSSAACRSSSRCRRCSSPPTSPSATPSRPSPRTSSRRCR